MGDGRRTPSETTLERIAKEVAEKLAQLPQGDEVWLTLSGGVCYCTGSENAVQSVQDLFARMDEALYRAKKEGGKNTLSTFKDEALSTS